MVYLPDLTDSILQMVVGVILYFLIGFVWFTPLFGKKYAEMTGMDPDAEMGGGAMAKSMGINIVGNIFTVIGVAIALRLWDSSGMAAGEAALTVTDGLMVGGLLWIAFFLPKDLGEVAWGGKPWVWVPIVSGYQLVSMLVLCALLVGWQ